MLIVIEIVGTRVPLRLFTTSSMRICVAVTYIRYSACSSYNRVLRKAPGAPKISAMPLAILGSSAVCRTTSGSSGMLLWKKPNTRRPRASLDFRSPQGSAGAYAWTCSYRITFCRSAAGDCSQEILRSSRRPTLNHSDSEALQPTRGRRLAFARDISPYI